jgi:hypothetical protein
MAAIDEDGEAHRGRPAAVHQGIHRSPNRATGEEHVVDEDDRRQVRRGRGRAFRITAAASASVASRSSRYGAIEA